MGAHTQSLSEIAPRLEKLAGTDTRKLCLRQSRRGGEPGTSYNSVREPAGMEDGRAGRVHSKKCSLTGP